MGLFRKLSNRTIESNQERYPTEETLEEYISHRALAIYSLTPQIMCYGEEACSLLHIDVPSEFPYLFCYRINKLGVCAGDLIIHKSWFAIKIILLEAPVSSNEKDLVAVTLNDINARIKDGWFSFDNDAAVPYVIYCLHVGYDELDSLIYGDDHSEEWTKKFSLYPDLLRETIGKAMCVTADYLDELAAVLKPESRVDM